MRNTNTSFCCDNNSYEKYSKLFCDGSEIVTESKNLYVLLWQCAEFCMSYILEPQSVAVRLVASGDANLAIKSTFL